jgi:hypothetical protein
MEFRYTRWTAISSLVAQDGKQGVLVDFHLEELYSFTVVGWD